jgi:hypothetical protein
MPRTPRLSRPSSTAVSSMERIGIVKTFADGPRPVHTRIMTIGTPAFVGWPWRLWSDHGFTPEGTAIGIVKLLLDPSAQKNAGIYWKHGQPVDPDLAVLDGESAKRLWKISEEMCGTAFACSLPPAGRSPAQSTSPVETNCWSPGRETSAPSPRMHAPASP